MQSVHHGYLHSPPVRHCDTRRRLQRRPEITDLGHIATVRQLHSQPHLYSRGWAGLPCSPVPPPCSLSPSRRPSYSISVEGLPVPSLRREVRTSNGKVLVPHAVLGQSKIARRGTEALSTCLEEVQSSHELHVPLRARNSTAEDELERFCEQGKLDRALDLLLGMPQQGDASLVPKYRCLLKACTKRKALAQAKRLHAHLVQRGLESTGFLGESVVKTLVKCGGLEDALNIFHRLPTRTVVSWTAVISGCCQAGQYCEVLEMYQHMQDEGVQPNAYTFASLIKAVGNMANLDEGKRIHVEVINHECEADLFVQTSLVDMYGKCGSTVDARHVFDELSHKNVLSWNVMLASYAQQGQVDEALQLYRGMQLEGRMLSMEMKMML